MVLELLHENEKYKNQDIKLNPKISLEKVSSLGWDRDGFQYVKLSPVVKHESFKMSHLAFVQTSNYYIIRNTNLKVYLSVS